MSALLLLGAVTAAGLLAVADALGVQRAADDLVTDAGQVLHAAAAHEHHRVLLQVVADARDVRGHLDTTGQADASDLAQRRVRLLRRRRVDAGAHPAALRGTLQRRGLGLLDFVLAALADQLVDRGHGWPGSPTCAGSCSESPCCAVVLAVPVLLGGLPAQVARHRPVHAVGRVALPRDRPLSTDRTRSPLATRRRPPRPSPGGTPVPGRQDLRTPRRTANGSRPRAPWARLTTIPAPKWPVQTGSPCRSGVLPTPAATRSHREPTSRSPGLFPTTAVPAPLWHSSPRDRDDSTPPEAVGDALRAAGLSDPGPTVRGVRTRSGTGGPVRIDSARELKARILRGLRAVPTAQDAGAAPHV